MGTYAFHHLERLRKTDSVTDEVKLVFSDLTAEEIASTFVRFTDPAKRDQVRAEIKYGSLLETAAWIAENMQQGCIKCAPYLARQMMKPYPDRPIQFVSSDQVPTFSYREKNMAYRILKQAVDNPAQEKIVAFVGKDHLMPVVQQLSNFLNDPEQFMEYERPPQVVEIESDSDGSIRKEMV